VDGLQIDSIDNTADLDKAVDGLTKAIHKACVASCNFIHRKAHRDVTWWEKILGEQR
jgi:hypothetical protein